MRTVRLRWVCSLMVSLAAAVVALVWLVAPASYPYGSGDNVRVGINVLIERGPAVAMLLTAAVLGILLSAIGLRAEATGAWLRVAGVGAAVEAAFFAWIMADASVLSTLGYAVALAGPIGVVVVLVLVCRKWHLIGYVLASLGLVLGVVGLATGALGEAGSTVASYLGNFTRDPEGYYPRMAWALGMAGAAAVWAWAAVGSLIRALPSWATPESAQRWGRVVTIVAALCPVPYGLARLSWLTPWRFGDLDPVADRILLWNSDPASLDGPTLIQGVLFALACALGVVLTLGLIRPWGEVFPRWLPVVAGRGVPAMLAVVPGTIVAAVIVIAAPGVLLGPIESGQLDQVALMLFFFPLPVWGPMLGAAVLAYWLRRTRGMSRDILGRDGGLTRASRRGVSRSLPSAE